MLPAQVREDVLDRETSLKLSTGKKLSTTHKELYVKKDEKSTCLRHSLSTGLVALADFACGARGACALPVGAIGNCS